MTEADEILAKSLTQEFLVGGELPSLIAAYEAFAKKAITAARTQCGQRETTRSFVNELGNQIRITIEGPTSTSENTLTISEAGHLREALSEAVPLAWRYRHRDWDPASPWSLCNEYPREHVGMGGRVIEPLGPFVSAATLLKLRSTAAMLYQNCLSYVGEHRTGSDALPGWLADAKKDIDAAFLAANRGISHDD